MRTRRCCLSFFAILVFAAIAPRLHAQPKPLLNVHAHNDYEHPHPLFDALAHGFCSVEADIWLVKGQLQVAHNRSQARPERTLQSLYLDPLRQRARTNGGRVYPNGPEVDLLIDIKSPLQETYPVLRKVLEQYSDILSTFDASGKHTNAVLAIISGDRDLKMFAGEDIRYAAFDGELKELDSTESADLIPWISSNWSRSFKWRGTGPFPEPEREKLKHIVAQAHERGRRVRFWGSPDQPLFWREIRADGVDLINTDDLAGAQK
ncbi:MAG: phosphatidylinositol-specific phospholipase C/glycerophosphodiester phosphodiesterase family protein, partial [Limisphaerales bacterium]